MTMQRLIQRSIPLAAVALIAAAPFVQAQRQEIFEWNGRVDREIQITMRGSQLATRYLSNTETGRARSRVIAQLPRQDGEVVVQLLNGRGDVNVIQQPSAQNGYTTIVRLTDRASGADDYRIAAYWQGYSNGDVYRRNDRMPGNAGNGRGLGRGRVRDRNDADDRDRDDRNGRGVYDRNGNTNGQYGNQTVLHWSGNVDGELELRIQNGRVAYRTLSGAQPTSIRADGANTSAMRSGMQVAVAQNQGRGTVTIVEQPTSYNGYTTVVRVRDPQGGYGFYDFDLIAR
jgi:hypothetical protein